MGLHLLALKLKLLLAAATYGTCPLVTATVIFLLKIPFSTRDIGRVCSNAFVASRLFIFRFGVIMFEDEQLAGMYNRQRWERAFRLFHERMISGWISEDHEDSLLAATMVAL
ncbi:hypothetical protein FRX31_034176 [Thalictrum thalictroides]|uniref:Uncharacterized protein n=1 Tax=Thalictrum thalictroides TaxID=46969 RepID=A0A7J6UUT6_THATH|nr:hypothetical protein FRX31_034176 [Thalictrum thalictroides]